MAKENRKTEEEYIEPEELEASKVTADAPRGNDAGDGAEAGDTGDGTGKTRKEERQQRRADREEEREQRRAENKENGTGFFRELGNDARALANGIRDDLKSDVNTTRGGGTEESEPVSPEEAEVARGGGPARGVADVTGQEDNGGYRADTARPDTTTPEAFNSTLEKRRRDFADTARNTADNPTVTPPPARTRETPVEETPTGEVTKNPTEDVTENPSAGGGLSPSVRNFAAGLDQRQKDFTQSIQDTADSLTSPTGAAAKGDTETAPAETAADAGKAGNAGEAADAGGSYADDPRVRAEEEANRANDEAYRDYLGWYDNFLEERRRYDEERERRDADNAFWRGIGEVGASLANLLGVSGAFGGRNAYGKGAYSAMQNFNLTTSGLTDRMRADREKRRERMDELKERQAQIGLQWGQLRAQGARNVGNAKGAAADAAEKRDEAQRNRDWQADQNQIKMNFQADEAQKDRDLKIELADRQNKASLQAAALRASGGSGKGDNDESKVRDVFRYVGTDEDGKPVDKRLVTDRKSLKHVFNNTAGWLADEIAREAGYRNYADFASADRKRRDEVGSAAADKAKYNDDVKRLELYDDALMLAGLTGLDTKNENALAEWVWSNGGGYEKYGDRVSDYLQLNGLLFTDDSSGPQGEVTEIIDYVPKSGREK